MTDIRYTGTEELEAMTAARNYNAFLVDQILACARPGDRVLDFGAGIGTFALALQDRGFPVLCVEPDQAQRLRIAENGLPALADLDEVPDASIDLLYSLNVLEHIEDDRAAMAEIARVLAPGGRVYLYVPAFMLLYSDFDRRIGHHRRYRAADLAALGRAAGLRVDRARYCDSLGFLAWMALRLAGRAGGVGRGPVAFYDRVLFPASRLLDRAVGAWFGKNVALVAAKPADAARAASSPPPPVAQAGHLRSMRTSRPPGAASSMSA